jgi:hypothetical protein
MSWSKHQVAILRNMLAQGATHAEIGVAVGKSRWTVRGQVRALGIAPAPKAKPVAKQAVVEQVAAHAPRVLVKRAVFVKPDRVLKSLFDLRIDECRFPFDGEEDALFCGLATAPGSSWCAEHRIVCLVGRVAA